MRMDIVLTGRWSCKTCGASTKLAFTDGPLDEDGHADEIDCIHIEFTCRHPMAEELADEIAQVATDEYFRAQEYGIELGKVMEVGEISPAGGGP